MTIGGAAATNVVVVSANSITATTPAGSVGAANVVVTNTDTGTVTDAGGFTYFAAPTITGVSPSSGGTTGGTSITISGTGFLSGTTVTIGGTAATNVVVVSATSITATTPAGSLGAANVVVTNTNTGTVTDTGGFTYVSAPAITGVSPNSGPTAGGTAITISGSGFLSGATVTIGGAAATNVMVVSANSITATTPAGSVGEANVVVTNTDTGTITATGGFTYSNLPTVTGQVIDDGTAQRSMVRSVTLAFGSTITSGQIPQILAQMSLKRVSDSLSVGLAATLVDSTHLKVTFTGSSIIGGSLADGRYNLVYNGATVLNSTQLWRLFGDLYGTASVNAADKTAFMAAMSSRKGMSNYSTYLDYQEDGVIVNADQTAFNQRNGTSI